MVERVRIDPHLTRSGSQQDPAAKIKPTGYKMPPVEHQFKPGESGNPGGRPKKLPNMKDELYDAVSEPIIVGKKRKPNCGRS